MAWRFSNPSAPKQKANPPLLLVAEALVASRFQFVCEALPGPDALSRQRLIRGHAEAFALQPDQAEIGARGTEVAVVAIQQQDARPTQRKTVGNRCPDRARSYNDDIRPHEILPC